MILGLNPGPCSTTELYSETYYIPFLGSRESEVVVHGWYDLFHGLLVELICKVVWACDFFLITPSKAGMMVHTCNLSYMEE
jgi:hypothetical protein